MNLKEAFRFQNKLGILLDETMSVLSYDKNITQVKNTYLRKKVMPEAENEETIDIPETDYADRITELAGFAMFLLAQRSTLFHAIRQAKKALPMDIDSESSMNAKRQEVARQFRHMLDLRGSELLIPNGGTGYRFNAEGNQVSYRCDVKRVTTINYDRNKIRAYTNSLSQQADHVSAELDKCLINTEVSFTPPFDVNDSFADIFEHYIGQENP